MAKRFRFRLEVVQKLRKQEVDRRRRIVSEAAHAVTRVEASHDQYTRLLRETMAASRDDRSTDRLEIASLRRQQHHRTWLHGRILSCQVDIASRREALDQRRRELAEASQQLKVIEKLREKQWSRHGEMVRREEQAAMDEVALQAYGMVARANERKVLLS